MVAPVRLGETFAPLSERPFRLLWLGRASSAAGDALMPLAVAFAVLSVDSSATALGAVLAAFWISRVAFTLVGGVVSDRLPRRAVMLACDGFRACIEAFTASMLLTHQMTLPIFIVTAGLFGPAIAGILIILTAPGWLFAVDSVSFLASAWFLMKLRIPAHERLPRSTFAHELRVGLHE